MKTLFEMFKKNPFKFCWALFITISYYPMYAVAYVAEKYADWFYSWDIDTFGW